MDTKSLPKITTKNWWGIRKKLKSTMPKMVSKSFVAAAMGIKEVSAQANVINPMIQLGLLDDKGAPTQLANEWRNDDTYPSACQKMRESTYPRELRDLAPDMDTDKTTVHNWIGSHLMVGTEAARQSMSVYMLLLEADASKEADTSPIKKASNKETASKTKSKPAQNRDKRQTVAKSHRQENHVQKNVSFDPSMNINIQIHIASDTNADQIDQIFSSMAKHLRSMVEA